MSKKSHGHTVDRRVDSWRDSAACSLTKGVDPRNFDPGANIRQIKIAKEICSTCPVIAECLIDALSADDPNDLGVRGGFTETEREALSKRSNANLVY